jgi:type IV fimbrial biogenesis protein FimT
MKRHGQRGFSLIELMVTITILGILVLLGIPSYQQWMLNTRIRTVTESIQNGLRLARNEASQRGADVRFQLNSATVWQVCAFPATSTSAATAVDCTAAIAPPIQEFNSAGASNDVQVTVSTNVADIATTAGVYQAIVGGAVPAGITFNSLGRPTNYGATSILRIDVTAAQIDQQAASKRLVTTISPGGMVNMCDPNTAVKYSNLNTQGCQ